MQNWYLGNAFNNSLNLIRHFHYLNLRNLQYPLLYKISLGLLIAFLYVFHNVHLYLHKFTINIHIDSTLKYDLRLSLIWEDFAVQVLVDKKVKIPD